MLQMHELEYCYVNTIPSEVIEGQE